MHYLIGVAQSGDEFECGGCATTLKFIPPISNPRLILAISPLGQYLGNTEESLKIHHFVCPGFSAWLQPTHTFIGLHSVFIRKFGIA
jgi:hypothetical protein